MPACAEQRAQQSLSKEANGMVHMVFYIMDFSQVATDSPRFAPGFKHAGAGSEPVEGVKGFDKLSRTVT